MDFKMKITLTLPEEMIKTMGISDDTFFITSFESGQIHVMLCDEDDLAEDIPGEGIFEEDYDDDTQEALKDAYESGYRKGAIRGYAGGYCRGLIDAHKGLPYNYYYRGWVNRCSPSGFNA